MKVLVLCGGLLSLTLSAYSQCSQFKEAVSSPKSVVTLDLTGCGVHVFPKEIFKCKNLTALHLGPQRLIMYRSNEGSPIGGNLFKNLQDDFGKLKLLQILNLQATDLRSLPESFVKLQHLKQLDLSFNPRLDSAVLFTILPKLTNLEKVNFTGCNLSKAARVQLETLLVETTCVFNKSKMIAKE